MGIIRRLLEDLESRTRPVSVVAYSSPNAPPDITPAMQPQAQPQGGVSRPFPGGGQFASVTLDANGNGIAQLGPQRVREHWQVTNAAVKVAGTVLQNGMLVPKNQAQCSVYFGTALASSTFLGNTASGSTGDTCGVGQDLQTGQSVFAQWNGGDPGAVATLTVFGTYSIGAPQ